uniref:Uncharacterized protein n=1 Tax=viral metagenome TaxID=1070528 RepID=A0A6C0HKP6_9ZZZZ
MPESTAASATDVPKAAAGTIPPPPPPNPAPASTNALGTTTPTATATLTTSSIGATPAVAAATDSTGKKSIIDAIKDGGKDMTADQVVFVVFVTLWIGFAIAGFIMSLWCLGFSGSASQKFGGFLFALFLGPFYWLYFYSVPSYCARLPPPSTLF